MKLKKLGAFAATGAMALALALTGCGSSNATSGSDASSSSSDDAKVEKVDGSKEYALVKDGTLTVNRIKVGQREDRRYTESDISKALGKTAA